MLPNQWARVKALFGNSPACLEPTPLIHCSRRSSSFFLVGPRQKCNQCQRDSMNASTTPPPLQRTPRNWVPAIIVSCVFAPLLILVIVFLSYRISNASAVRKLEAEIKRKGEPLTLADLAVTYPPIPDEENGAVLLVELWKKEDPEFWTAFLNGVRPLPTRPDPRWDDALPLLGAEARRISRTTELTPENLAAAAAFVEERAEHFEKLRQALRKPKFRFPIKITDGINTLIPHLGHVKSDAQGFQIEVLLASPRSR